MLKIKPNEQNFIYRKDKTIAIPPHLRNQRNKKEEARTNGEIRVPKVRLVDENGEQLGVVSTKEALERAMDAGLDLVEVSPNAEPPVCKILDYGKFKYQSQKKAADARKKQVKVNLKEITLRPGTEENDYQVKLKKMREFLEKGDKVKVTIRFRGRELGNKEAGVEMLNRIGNDLVEYGKVDVSPKAEGRQMHILLSSLTPKKN